ncbi:NAD(P)/FAD-dependent oxidoreductase [Acidisphaera sp. L21]|uniref:NAD(P)/FAD-dependent oxidoreductase n=1 Tax=Acidisphaera sp. L21 TaxID=1641851 RepID=UPI00131CE945|nr:NAD(P)/FAD-dependent oxidoreductase [Acidisphaera sp. L21]
MQTEPPPNHLRVVIIGAGFGGLYAAKRLANAAGIDVTLIDRSNHHLFQPLLYQVATAALSPADIATPIRSVFSKYPNIRVVMGEATAVDPAARTVTVRDTGDFPYDMLVLATGAATSWFGHADWAGASLGLKSLGDAEAIRSRLLGAFEWAESRTDPDEIARLLTFVVVGAGPTGVELAGSIAELARSTLARDYRHISPAKARVVLCDAGDRVLSSFPNRLSAYAAARLKRLGVELKLNAAVELVDADGIVAAGQRIRSATILWAAGVAANPAAGWLGITPAKHGTLAVEENLSVAGHPDIFAIGDVMTRPGPDGKPLPGLATVAKQQGRYVGDLIAKRAATQPAPGPFRYRDLGSLAIVGRSAAVADFGWLRLTGVLAWLTWGGVHLLLLMGMRNRAVVYVTWIWSWLTWGRGARLITDTNGDLSVNRPETPPPYEGSTP